MIVLDTDVLIEVLDRRSERGAKALDKLGGFPDDTVATTSINLHEILYGCIRHSKPVGGLSALHVLPFTKVDSELSSRMESDLEGSGAKVQRADAMIAAIAVNNGARLFTYNAAHFQRMASHGLRLVE